MIKRFTFLFLLSSFYTFGQHINEKSLKFSANYGSTSTSVTDASKSQHLELGLTYMSDNFLGIENDNIWGLKLDLGFDKDRIQLGTKEIGTNYMRGAAQGLCNLSNLITPARFRSNINFNTFVHAGAGWALQQSTIHKGGIDHIINVLVGINPQYNLTKNISVNIDGTVILNTMLDYNFDGNLAPRRNRNGLMYNLSAGISYTFHYQTSIAH